MWGTLWPAGRVERGLVPLVLPVTLLMGCIEYGAEPPSLGPLPIVDGGGGAGGDGMLDAMPDMRDAMPGVPDGPPDIRDAMPDIRDAMPDVPDAMPDVRDAMPDVPDAMPDVPDATPDVPDATPDMPDAMPDAALDPCGLELACLPGELCRRDGVCAPVEALARRYLKGLVTPNAQFGYAVAATDRWLAIGARSEEVEGVRNAGRVYLFEVLPDGLPALVMPFSGPRVGEDGYFGDALALADEVLVVGASRASEVASLAGAAYVYERVDGVWVYQQSLAPAARAEDDRFGFAVAVSGDRIAVGASGEDGPRPGEMGEQVDSGAVFVFERTEGGWQPQAYLKAPNAGVSHRFGQALAFDGGRLVVGAPGESGDAASTLAEPNSLAIRAGAVYVFEEDDGWAATAYLKAPNVGETDEFGAAVAYREGGPIVVGAPYEDGGAASTLAAPDEAAEDAGAVYVFQDRGEGWVVDDYLKASPLVGGALFGWAVAASATRIAVGAPLDPGDATSRIDAPNGEAPGSGAAHLFGLLPSGGWRTLAYLKAANAGEDDGFGQELAISERWIAVGASGEDGDGESRLDAPNDAARSAGAVYLFEH